MFNNSSDGCKEATLLFSSYVLLSQILSSAFIPTAGLPHPLDVPDMDPTLDNFPVHTEQEKVTQVWFKAQINRKSPASPGHIEHIS